MSERCDAKRGCGGEERSCTRRARARFTRAGVLPCRSLARADARRRKPSASTIPAAASASATLCAAALAPPRASPPARPPARERMRAARKAAVTALGMAANDATGTPSRSSRSTATSTSAAVRSSLGMCTKATGG